MSPEAALKAIEERLNQGDARKYVPAHIAADIVQIIHEYPEMVDRHG